MLNPLTIYRKTDAGVAEVQARALGLRAELRRLLILIDGNSSLDRLAAFVRGSEIDFLIAELEIQGLVTSSTMGGAAGFGASASSASANATSPVAHPAPSAPSTRIGGDDVGPEPSAAQVQAVRQAAIRTLHSILGPDADALAVRIERCKDSREIRAAVNDIRQILDRQMGINVGQRFLDAVRGAAEGSR